MIPALTILLAFLTSTSSFGQAFLPTAVPDRVMLSWETSPASSQSVSWRTDISVTEAFAEIGVADASPDFQLATDTLTATTELFQDHGLSAHYHSVNFTGLQPGTKYAYRVSGGGTWSEWYHFTTATAGNEPYSFIYFGDAQNDIKSLWSRAIREAVLKAPAADFMLHAGDLINRSYADNEWGEWFYAGGWVYGTIPSIATPGNHEYGRRDNSNTAPRVLSPQWKPTFRLPQNGPDSLRETVYYLDYQGTRFISLNTTAMFMDSLMAVAQLTWLEEVLKDNPNRWTVVTHHHPIYSAGQGRNNQRFRETFQPLYERYGVDLVLQGHDHTYARGGNQLPGQPPANQSGPVYVVSVSGPKMYESAMSEWMDRVAMNTQLFQIIDVSEKELVYRAYTATGDWYDGFTLKKKGNGSNKFVDEVPKGVPQRLELPKRALERMEAEDRAAFDERFRRFKARTEKN